MNDDTHSGTVAAPSGDVAQPPAKSGGGGECRTASPASRRGNLVWNCPTVRVMAIERTASGSASFPCSTESANYEPYYRGCSS